MYLAKENMRNGKNIKFKMKVTYVSYSYIVTGVELASHVTNLAMPEYFCMTLAATEETFMKGFITALAKEMKERTAWENECTIMRITSGV